jgi:hypothetical protein
METTMQVFNKGYTEPVLVIHATYESYLDAGRLNKSVQWYEAQGCTVKTTVDGHELVNGIIRNPGKFEGESLATLYYYDSMLNGDGCVMEVSAEERAAFDLAEDDKFVYLAESGSGFVSLEFYPTREQAEEAEEESDRNEGLELGDLAEEDF